MGAAVNVMALLIVLLMIINIRLILSPRVIYQIVPTPRRRSSGGGCLLALLMVWVMGMLVLVFGGL